MSITTTRGHNFIETHLKTAKLYTIHVPKELKWDPERAATYMQHLLNLFVQSTFLITADRDQIAWQYLDLWHPARSHLIIQAIQTSYPEVQVEATSYQLPEFHQPFYRGLVLYKQASDFVFPIKSVQDIKNLDPLASLVQAMRDLREGERVTHMLHVMGPISTPMLEAAQKRITQSQINPFHFLSTKGMGQALGIALAGNPRMPRYQERDQRILEDRLRNELLYNVFVMTQVDVQRKVALDRVANLISVMAQFASEYNGLLPAKPAEDFFCRVDTPQTAYVTSGLGRLGSWFEGQDAEFPQLLARLSPQELAALWHLPHSGFSVPEISFQPGGEVQIPAALARNTQGICLGINQYSGRQTLVWMRDEDRGGHMSIFGKTGVGKSTLMQGMIHQDIQAGKGVGVIDPHGKLVTDLLRYSIPDRRINDVVLLDIANEDYPPPLNPLVIPGEANQLAVGQVVAVLDKIYEIKAQRAEDSLTAALMTILPEPSPTLRDVVRVFTDPAYRHQLLHRVNDPVTIEFWDEFERMSPSVQRELSYPVLHRLRLFYRNASLYPMLCHPDALNFAKLIQQQKIILVSLGIDERKVPPPEQQLLGALVISLLQMAAMQNLEHVTPFNLYDDEAQNHVTSSLDQVLSEARKYGVRLILANQYTSQLKGNLLDSIIGNVAATFIFQCGLNDARLLEPYVLPELSGQDLMNLPLYHAAVKMRHAGQTLPAFTMQTLPPPIAANEERALAREALIRKRSAAQYTPKTRSEILAWLEARYPQRQSVVQIVDEDDPTGPIDWGVPEGK